MKSVNSLRVFENVPILVRAALNEPAGDTFRVERAIPTLKFLSEKNARVIVISHLGEAGTETLRGVAEKLAKLIPRLSFFPETIGPNVRAAIRSMSPGDILVLENLRRNRGEVHNDPEFAKELAMLADVFVEDSFDTCHRAHASIVGVPPLLPSYAGLELMQEVEELTKALSPASPSLAIIGGAKFSTKEPVVRALLARYDKVFVGGALANDFLKAQGKHVGISLGSDSVDQAQIKTLSTNPKLLLPLDSLVSKNPTAGPSAARVALPDDVKPDEMILDHGPATQALLNNLVAGAKTILWNGPLGNYENGFVGATDALALAIAQSAGITVIGGGDTVTAIEKLDILNHFSFVSIGGGAMLDFLAQGTLPGIQALA